MEIYDYNKADVRAAFIMSTLILGNGDHSGEQTETNGYPTKFLSQGEVLECSGSAYCIKLSPPALLLYPNASIKYE